jgi:drug/metabolite transporter (DMT)-like permease
MNAQLAGAYLLLIIVWSTTALAIKWGVTGIPFTMALMLRFVLAAGLAGLLLAVKRQALPRDAAHRRAYLIAGTATALSMLCSFWAAQYIASGLIAVLFGLSPLATGFFAARYLHTPMQGREWLAIGISLLGLLLIFAQNLTITASGLLGISALLLAMSLQSGAAVLLKKYANAQSALCVNAGALLVCATLTIVFWLLSGAPIPAELPTRALAALIYLASIGSVLAFSLYYWLIQQCRPMNVALISLITPAASLWLGHGLNQEQFLTHELIGTGLILLGLMIHTLKSRP